MRSSATFLLFSGLFSLVRAVPTARASTGCDVSQATIPLPSGQTALTNPTDAKPVYIAAGIGTQNYSCGAAGTYVSIGAVAKLYDASCVYKAIIAISGSTSPATAIAAATAALGTKPSLLGHHYFVSIGGAAPAPKFDFTQSAGDPNAFVVTAKKGDIPSPQNPTKNVDWLELTGNSGQGNLAKDVFRIFTFGGQPPTSCTPGSAPIEVPYVANYWLFK